jgi:rRNA processing protein Krr1/Pno1
MEKIVSRVKLLTVGWDDTMALRVLKNQYSKTVFRLKREEYCDERERDCLIGEAMDLQNLIADY